MGSGDTFGRCGRRCCFTSSPFSFSLPVFSSPEPSFHTTVIAPTCQAPLASLPTTDLAGPNPQLTVLSSSFSMLSGTLLCLDDVHNYHHSLITFCSVIRVSGLISLFPAPSSQVTYLTYSSLAKRFFFLFFFLTSSLCCVTDSKPWMDKLPVLKNAASTRPLSARIFKAIADPPTTSLQRLKV